MKRASSLEELVITPDGPKPPKCYKNATFLGSHDARMIRVMCELEEPKVRLDEEGVDNIVMFFGSGRAKSKAEYEKALASANAAVKAAPSNESAKSELALLKKQAFITEHYQSTLDLAGLLTKWSMDRMEKGKPSYIVGTGGRPGMNAAANEGAAKQGGKSVGFTTSIASDNKDDNAQCLNPHVTPELSFEFHYFFTRKFWMAYKCMGIVATPGGFATCDELFEIMTLMQVGKIKRKVPIILFGKKYWQDVIDWQAFVDYGMISESDSQQLHFTDSAEEAFRILVTGIEAIEELESAAR